MNFLMKIDGTGFWPSLVAPVSAGVRKEIEEKLKASKKAKATARAKRRKAPAKSARPA